MYFPRNIPDTFAVATRLTHVQPIQESVRPVVNLWYHLVPKGVDLRDGIISPYYMEKSHNTELLLSSLKKYRSRLVDGWGVYPERNGDELTAEEILSGLVKYRGTNGDRMIYLFRYPPTSDLGTNMEKVLNEKDVYEVDLDKVPDIIEIDYGHEGSNTDNKKLSASYYRNISRDQYFKNYDDNTNGLLFAQINHISVATKSGRIPPDAIRKLDPIQIANEVSLSLGKSLSESTAYSPAISDFSSPNFDHKSSYVSEEKASETPDDSNVLFGIADLHSADEMFFGSDDREIAAEIPDFLSVDYFDFSEPMFESAMKANERNALDDAEFGLPRLRKYPLHDRKHVAQAIRMFGHVKIESDRKTLAAAIVKKYDEFQMTTKVGKNNPLYKYVPDRMKMISISEGTKPTVYGFEKPHEERNRKDIVMEHLRMNDTLYNNLFFTDEYAEAVKKMHEKHREYLEYFYPSFKIHSLVARMKTSIGGIYSSLSEEDLDYQKLLKSSDEEFETYCTTHYNAEANWYRTDHVDLKHIRWCLELYQLLHRIIYEDGNAEPEDVHLMMEWNGNVEYHSALMREAKEYSEEYFIHCQYLHDMVWDPLDNPEDNSVCGANVISFVQAIHPDSTGRVNESGEMIKKQDVLGYLAKELKMDDTIYLVPGMMQYPVIDATSVRLAMDNIRHVEEENIEEYVKNLNRKYQELHCEFKISADHPYAKYALEQMKCIEHVLTESDGNPKDDRLPKEYQIAKNIYYKNEGIYYI